MVIFVVIIHIFALSRCVRTRCLDINDKLTGNNTNMDETLKYIDEIESLAVKYDYNVSITQWNYESNLTLFNRNAYLTRLKELADFNKLHWNHSTSFAWKNLKRKNETAYRIFKAMTNLGVEALPNDELDEFNEIVSLMQETHSTAKFCFTKSAEEKPKCNIPFDPYGLIIMQRSKNYEILKNVWIQYRNETGAKYKDKFIRYKDLLNKAACLNGFSDAGGMWLEEFDEDENILEEFVELWEEIKPFYEHLHAYVRNKLMKLYPNYIKENGPIPAHILGEIMPAHWLGLYDLVAPYPDKKDVNVSQKMKEKNMTITSMVKLADEFFTSLGMIPMSRNFWKNSIFQKPKDKEIVCHPSSMDFHANEDVRIRMCIGDVGISPFLTLHHEMGHCVYFLQYAHQPFHLQFAPNSGFHEAVGDTIALSASAPVHLKKMGLLDYVDDDREMEINSLMKMALNKIVAIPYAIVTDFWRWKIFDDSIPVDQLNAEWWNYTLKYQGLCPPTLRTEMDFDAGAINHVASSTPFIRYFISNIIQFQFHKILCNESGYEGPLHKCDIYQSKKAGKLLSGMLKLGSSVSWRKALKVLTRGKTDKIETNALFEYFRPLIDWLKIVNKNNVVGWKSDNPSICP